MKNLIYVLAIAVMGLVACGAPAEKECAADCTKECCAVAPAAEETTADTVEVVAEEAEMMDSTATEEVAE